MLAVGELIDRELSARFAKFSTEWVASPKAREAPAVRVIQFAGVGLHSAVGELIVRFAKSSAESIQLVVGTRTPSAFGRPPQALAAKPLVHIQAGFIRPKAAYSARRSACFAKS